MSDPRYKNGIKKNTSITLERPADHGWSELGINPQTGRMVYGQDGCQLTRLFGPGWFATNRAGVTYHITGGMLAEITAFILADPHLPIVCIECDNIFDSRLPEHPVPVAPVCNVCLKESVVNVLEIA